MILRDINTAERLGADLERSTSRRLLESRCTSKLLNAPNNRAFEFGYWGRIDIRIGVKTDFRPA